jgi:CBS domain-containing protein
MLYTVRHLLEVKGPDVWSITPDKSVYDALRMMADKGIGALLVMQDDKLAGILSERDYARKVILMGKTSKETLVSEIMSTRVFTIHPDQTVEEAMEMMSHRHVRHLPVTVDEEVLGVISIGDVVNNIIHRQRETIKSLSKHPENPEA